MNNDFAILISPLGCFARAGASHTFQRDTQSYQRDARPTDQLHQRKKLVRAILSVRRLTPEVDRMIRAHLQVFDLKDVWTNLSPERRAAASVALYERVNLAAAGRANGMTTFTDLLGEDVKAARDHVGGA